MPSPCLNECTLSSGKKVQAPWSGHDDGRNYCNRCSCTLSGALICTQMFCLPKPYNPCEGKKAGDICTLCSPLDKRCIETKELKTCDANGRCTSGRSRPSPGATCTAGTPDYTETIEHCGKPFVPFSCSCGQGTATWQCQVAMPPRCTTTSLPAEYNPCEGKKRGASCTVCAPFAKGCFETQELKACDAAGQCVASKKVCAKDSKPKFCARRLDNQSVKKIGRLCKRKNFKKKCQASCGLPC